MITLIGLSAAALASGDAATRCAVSTSGSGLVVTAGASTLVVTSQERTGTYELALDAQGDGTPELSLSPGNIVSTVRTSQDILVLRGPNKMARFGVFRVEGPDGRELAILTYGSRTELLVRFGDGSVTCSGAFVFEGGADPKTSFYVSANGS